MNQDDTLDFDSGICYTGGVQEIAAAAIRKLGIVHFHFILLEDIMMRKNFGAKPYTYPQPVFIIATYGPDGTPDAMNAA